MCRAPLEVICCRISDGLEMGLEREFMPPITEKRAGYPKHAPRTKQLTRKLNTPQPTAKCRTAANKEGRQRKKEKEKITAFNCAHVLAPLPDCVP